jgi:DNA polymerase-3 subunit alpha
VFDHPLLEPLLKDTYGIIVYQEQVMQIAQVLAGYTPGQADLLRKAMGKKIQEILDQQRDTFLKGCKDNNVDKKIAEKVFDLVVQFGGYGFNKSHAWAYAVMGYWCAWFKVNYPIEFMTAVLSTVDKKRIPEFIAEARRMGYMVLPPDVNESGNDFTAGDLACRYGFEGVEGISDKTSDVIVAAQPYASLEDFRERSGVNKGILKTLARVGALDRFVGNRRALVEQLEWEDSEEGARCIHKDESVVSAHGLPCTFDWDGEPVEIGARGRPKKKKPPPKRCTRACRHYTAPPEPDWDSLPDYDPKEVREMESELLGIFLSSTPFDEVLEALKDDPPYTGYQMDNGPSGDYGTLGLVRRVKKHFDRHGREMAFLTLLCVDQEIDITVFKDDWSEWGGLLSVDTLLWCIVRKSNGRYNLNTNNFDPVIIPNH